MHITKNSRTYILYNQFIQFYVKMTKTFEKTQFRKYQLKVYHYLSVRTKLGLDYAHQNVCPLIDHVEK